MNNTLGRGVAAGTPAAAPGLWRPGLRTVPPSGGAQAGLLGRLQTSTATTFWEASKYNFWSTWSTHGYYILSKKHVFVSLPKVIVFEV